MDFSACVALVAQYMGREGRLGHLALALARVPCVATFHAHGPLGWMKVGKPLWGFLADRLDYRIAVSQHARDTAAAWLPGDYDIVPNGVLIPPEADPHGREHQVVFAGRQEARKGLHVADLHRPRLVAIARANHQLSAVAALPAVHAISRGVMVALLRTTPARDDGLARAVSTSTTPLSAAVAIGVTGVLGIGLLGAWFVPAAAVALVAGWLVRWLAMRRIGGMTGDVLGAAEQLAEGCLLILFNEFLSLGNIPAQARRLVQAAMLTPADPAIDGLAGITPRAAVSG